MAAPRPTVRTIAKQLNLSRSTISNALRGAPGVSAETRRRVQVAADALGYSLQPFASEVMSQLRKARDVKLLGTLAVLEMDEPGRPAGAALFNRRLYEGMESRAKEMGFAVTHWKFGGPQTMALKRLGQVLHWRGIQGLLLLPTWGEPDFSDLDWSHFTAVYADYLIRRPAVHTVSSDHFRRLFDAMEKARELGYRRPGLAIERRGNERLHGRWVGAYLGYLHDHPEMTAVPPLLVGDFSAETFLPWFREHNPDVVITHWIGAPEQMAAAGAEIPRTHGCICLNVLPAAPGLSGFDQRPALLGMRAAELVVSQLGHHERGVPTVPSNTLLPAHWVEGTSVARRN